VKYLIVDNENSVVDFADDMEGAKKKAHDIMINAFEASEGELFSQLDALRTVVQELESNIRLHQKPFKILAEAEVNPDDYSTDS
jgi:hypothetical protein